MTNIITACFGGTRYANTRPAWLIDHGMVLKLSGVELPETYFVDFANSKAEQATRVLGNADGVVIPDEYFLSKAQQIYAWVYLTTGDSGFTTLQVTIPLAQRPDVTDEPPTPQETDLIEQAIAALNDGVERAETAADTAEDAADEAKEAAANVKQTVEDALQEAKDSGEFDGEDGANGVTYTPTVDAEGNISWTNDGGLPNPQPRNIMGPQGEKLTYADLTAADKADLIQGPIAEAQTAAVEAVEQKGEDVLAELQEYADLPDEVSTLKSALTLLDNHVRYEYEEIIAENDIHTSSGTKIDANNSRFNVVIASGVSFRFRASGTGLINRFALYCNNVTPAERFATNLLPNTNYEFTAMTDVTSLYIYTGGSDVVGDGTLKLIAANVVFNNNSVDKHIADLEEKMDILQPLSGDEWTLNKNEFTELCIHHDNFSRTMTGWEIGMNAGGSDTGNNYDWVTPSDYNDGLTVNNGATFTSGTRTYNYSLREIASENADNFMIETNAPVSNAPVMFGFNVTDVNNCTVLELRKNNAGYKIVVNVIKSGIKYKNLMEVQANQIIAQVAQIYVVRGVLYLLLDDRFCASAYVGSLGNHVYLASYKSYNTHFDFVNVFSLIEKVTWNPNPTLDTGESDIPLKTISAGTGNYELQDDETRWSNYADHFTLHSTDELIHNGRRSEISLSNMDLFKPNLRTFKVSFDVLFPSEYVDTEQGDLFVQFHDRDGTYRGTVPFALYIKDHTININTSSTVKPKDDSTTVIIGLHRFDFCDVELGKWHRLEIECKERYEARQNPFLRIKIDGITQFEYRKANCYNDLLGTSPQYGIYKNNWGTGVTEFQRYFDNFKIEYC